MAQEGTLKELERIMRRVIEAEKTSSGRVNLIGMIFVGLAGLITGEIFSHVALLFFILFIISAIFSDIFSHYLRK